MSRLEAFLNAYVERLENVEYVATTRFKDDEGAPLVWELKTITEKENSAIKRDCARIRPTNKYGQTVSETDIELYSARLAVACTVMPDLNNAELQDKFGAVSAESLLQKMLLPGEYADYLMKVQSINGFETGLQELIDEAKN